MNIFTLLSEKNIGLMFGCNYNKVNWFESTAAASHVSMEEDEPDFDVLVLSNVRENDYVIVRADTAVEETRVDGEVRVYDVNGVGFTFKCYKVLTSAEIFA